jgi:hypothetical protein
MIPENENSSLRALLHAKKQNEGIEQSDLQKIELISKHLSELQEELAKFNSPRCNTVKYFRYWG